MLAVQQGCRFGGCVKRRSGVIGNEGGEGVAVAGIILGMG